MVIDIQKLDRIAAYLYSELDTIEIDSVTGVSRITPVSKNVMDAIDIIQGIPEYREFLDADMDRMDSLMLGV